MQIAGMRSTLEGESHRQCVRDYQKPERFAEPHGRHKPAPTAAMPPVRLNVAVVVVLVVPPLVVAAQTPPAVSVPHHLTLDQALTEALNNNLTLIAARSGVTVADANLVTAGLRPNPILSIGGDHLDFAGTGFDDVNGAGPPEYQRACGCPV